MGCGSSIHRSLPSTPPGRGAPAPASPREIVDTATPPAGSDKVGDSINRVFSVNPEPHKEFLPCISPSAKELACRLIVEKLVSRKSEEIARKEIQEVLQQWKERGQLADIESYSLSVPPSLTRSVVDLSDFLTRSSAGYIMAIEGPEVHTQIAKAYCIYSWIANNITFDRHLWQAYQSGDDNLNLDNDTQAEHVLESCTAVSSGYANLFKSLANKCGMMVEVVHGNIKVWRSQSPESQENHFEASRKNAHTWNLITLGGNAYPVDCTMGSGFISPNAEYQKNFTCHFFATPPQRMILTHWPAKTKQQLLKEPLTLNKFRPLIPLSPKAAEYGINPDIWSEHLEIPVESHDPVVSVNLTCNANVKLIAKLSNIQQEADDSSDTHEVANQKLVYINKKVSHTKQETSIVNIRAAIPHTGWHTLNIYACKSSKNASTSNYEVVLSYQLQCSTDIGSQYHIGYPILYDMAASAFDFQLLHWNKPMPDYWCENALGKLDIAFRTKPDLQFFHYIVKGKVENSGKASNTYHHNTLIAQNECDDPHLYALRTVFPSPGWWTVYLCATKPVDSDNQQPTVSGYTTVFKYCVHVKNGDSKQSFPQITVPYIKLMYPETISTSGNEILNVPFYSLSILEFYCYLTYETQTSELMENYATIAVSSSASQPDESQGKQNYNLSVIFPKPGKWFVHVYGRDRDSTTTATQKYTGLFTLNMDVEGALRDKLFPIIDTSIATALNISCYETGCITFCDDGSPFTYRFKAPRRSLHLIPNIVLNGEDNILDKKFLQRCTLLSPSPTDDSELSIYTMNAVFPSAGTWSVQLFGAHSEFSSDGYDLVMHIQLQVTKPILDMCYPTIYPAFYDLGLSIPNELLLYSQVSEGSEVKFPFNSPEAVVFDTRLSQGNEVFINQAIVQYHRDTVGSTTQNCSLHIIFPRTGQWIIHLYAGSCNVEQDENYQPDDSNIEKMAVLELKIKALSCNDTFTFPQIFDPFYSKFSLRLDELKYPLVSRVRSVPSRITIPFYSPPSVQFWHHATIPESEMPRANSITRMYSDPQTGLHELSVEIAELGQVVVTLTAQISNSSDNKKRKWITVLKHTVRAL